MTIPITYKSTMQTHKMNLLGEEINNFQTDIKKASQSGNQAGIKKLKQKQNYFNSKYGITGTRFRLKMQNHLFKGEKYLPFKMKL